MTTHTDSPLPMQHLDLSIRGELVETVVEEGEWRMELEHLTLQQKRK